MDLHNLLLPEFQCEPAVLGGAGDSMFSLLNLLKISITICMIKINQNFFLKLFF